MNRIHGSYALTISHDDTVLGVRDPKGNRPLCIGKLEDGYILASESAAIDTLDGELVRDVRPGELVVLEEDGQGFDSYQLIDAENTAHCFSSTSTSPGRTASSTTRWSTRHGATSGASSGRKVASRPTS